MELFTRLISEGVFAYWNDDKNSDKYVIKLYIVNADKKSELFSEAVSGNRHCFSADKLGSGEYQIEVSSFLNEQLVETVNKKVNLSSSIQKITELKDVIDDVKRAIESVESDTSNINNHTSRIEDLLNDPAYYCDKNSWAKFIYIIQDLIRGANKYGGVGYFDD